MGLIKIIRNLLSKKNKARKGTAHEREEGANTSRVPIVNQPPESQFTDATLTPRAFFNQVQNTSIYEGNFMERSYEYAFELLQSRVSPSAFHNSAQRVDPPRCHLDTRLDTLQNIYEWIFNSDHHDEWLIWLNGAADVGKSAIMQSMAERCALMPAIAIGCFFFDRSDPTRNSMTPVVSTLAYQLVQSIPETLGTILLILSRNPLIFEQSIESQIQQLLIRPLLHLPANLQRLFVVFIDGLNECIDQTHQSNLIRVITSISNGRNIPIKFLISSRREPHIEAEFFRISGVAGNSRAYDMAISALPCASDLNVGPQVDPYYYQQQSVLHAQPIDKNRYGNPLRTTRRSVYHELGMSIATSGQDRQRPYRTGYYTQNSNVSHQYGSSKVEGQYHSALNTQYEGDLHRTTTPRSLPNGMVNHSLLNAYTHPSFSQDIITGQARPAFPSATSSESSSHAPQLTPPSSISFSAQSPPAQFGLDNGQLTAIRGPAVFNNPFSGNIIINNLHHTTNIDSGNTRTDLMKDSYNDNSAHSYAEAASGRSNEKEKKKNRKV